MSDTYCYLRVQGTGRDSGLLLEDVQAKVFPQWRESGITPWGVFGGLFGVASNELIVMAAARGTRGVDDFTAGIKRVANVQRALALRNTVRPTAIEPLKQPGLYVFRFFDVDNKDVNEIAELSRGAWTTFEDTRDYSAEPQGLFCESDLSADQGKMLLLTWYDGLQSWQTSRTPHPDARENFRQRSALTRRTIAFATRLVSIDEG
jgi:hypothetical protein